MPSVLASEINCIEYFIRKQGLAALYWERERREQITRRLRRPWPEEQKGPSIIEERLSALEERVNRRKVEIKYLMPMIVGKPASQKSKGFSL